MRAHRDAGGPRMSQRASDKDWDWRGDGNGRVVGFRKGDGVAANLGRGENQCQLCRWAWAFR